MGPDAHALSPLGQHLGRFTAEVLRRWPGRRVRHNGMGVPAPVSATRKRVSRAFRHEPEVPQQPPWKHSLSQPWLTRGTILRLESFKSGLCGGWEQRIMPVMVGGGIGGAGPRIARRSPVPAERLGKAAVASRAGSVQRRGSSQHLRYQRSPWLGGRVPVGWTLAPPGVDNDLKGVAEKCYGNINPRFSGLLAR